ncbi:23S rRNA (adenine(2503)-C(2))-methyltransferase RlmN [Anaerolentibacter hominis]|uniref:23S rRNA (adenine(2503)-C(2))-methyltransferase RlmN n=1 Tax=Anaerolentibacter hominis TaxID=3079009 RepID=UPI0031B87C72
MDAAKDIKSYGFEELDQILLGWGEKSFRTRQIYEWIHKKLVSDFDEMTNLSKALRERLKENFCLGSARMLERQVSEIDGTAKYLWELSDGSAVESVWMKYQHGNSVCISSQVGCRMGCRFCASTIGGLTRNLLPGEMLDQVYRIEKISGERVSNIVVMGSGEPLDNYDNFVKFVRMVSDERGLNISQRNITASTCGLTEQMRRLADEDLAITLAISLHAPNDEVRKTLMPVALRYSIEEILDACRYYYERTKRRITFEYSLVRGVNDSERCAAELARRLKGLNCHVNLIPVNPIKERDYRQSGQADILKFKNLLEKYRINVTIRREMGADIDAACGQLRKSYIDRNISEREENA